jgi:hypothetical protein
LFQSTAAPVLVHPLVLRGLAQQQQLVDENDPTEAVDEQEEEVGQRVTEKIINFK